MDNLTDATKELSPTIETINDLFKSHSKLSLTLFATFGILLVHYAKVYGSRTERLLSQFDQVQRWPIVGYIPYLLRPIEAVAPLLALGAKQFGRTVVAWVAWKPYMIVMEGGIVAEAILTTSKYLDKAKVVENVETFLGKGIVTSEASVWKEDRKRLNPFFKIQNFDKFIRYFNKHSRTLLRTLDEVATTGKVVDFHPIISRTTLDFVCDAVLAKEIDFQNYGGEELLEALRIGSEICRSKIFLPWIKLPGLWTLLGWRAKEKHCHKMLRDHVLLGVQTRRKLVNSAYYKEHMEATDFPPLYQCLLDTRTDEEIMYHVSSFIIAGYETTATTMNYILFLLALYPQYQERAREEVDQIFNALTPGEDLGPNQVADLKYMEMCIKETIRLYPTAPLVTRHSTVDIPLEDGRIIPQGVDIIFVLPEIHRDPKVWPNPEVFDPERFTPELCITRNAVQYMPFSAGPRNCIGNRYGMIQMKVCMSYVLRNFTITTESVEKEIGVLYGPLLEPARSIWLKFTKREMPSSAPETAPSA